MADFNIENKTDIDETYPRGSQSIYVIDDSIRETKVFMKNVLAMISGFPDFNVLHLAKWTTATRPAIIKEGLFGYNETTKKFERHNGTEVVSVELDVEEANHADTATLADTATQAVTATNALQLGGSSASLISMALIPTGGMIMLPFSTIPTGFLLCNGQAVSRTTYPALFSMIGTTYGSGDGINTFNLPDMRGVFPRGLGGNSAGLGIVQGDAIRNITGSAHPFDDLTQAYASFNGAFGYTVESGNCAGSRNWESATRINFDASRVVPTANENRPVNMAFNFIIKY